MPARQTPLYRLHAELGAKFFEFAGWTMPLTYPAGSRAEHLATRRSAALFDTSHMSRFIVEGGDAAAALARAVSADVTKLSVGTGNYALLLRDGGGVIDDMLVYRVAAQQYLVVANAARAELDLALFTERLAAVGAAEIEDITERVAMIALQGPVAVDVAGELFGQPVRALPRFGIERFSRGDQRIWAARTGYTGEDGLEIFPPADGAVALWRELTEIADRMGVRLQPAGLAARDTLRLEAGFALYGHELTEDVTPVEARLLWACDLDHDFIGRDAVVARRSAGAARTLRRLVMVERGVPRAGYPVVDAAGATVGTVVSGAAAPYVDDFIANAYVDRSTDADATLSVEIRGKRCRARQHRGPVYRPNYIRARAPGRRLERGAEFLARHLGSGSTEARAMAQEIGYESVDRLVDRVVPREIRLDRAPELPAPLTEDQVQARLKRLAAENTLQRALIGRGYYGTITPPVIRRTVLENPRWYTQYTPYQAEISQGRLEALVNFQTMVIDLCALPVANASLLDEVTAVGEALAIAVRRARGTRPVVYAAESLHPQTLVHLRTRVASMEVELRIADPSRWQLDGSVAAGIVQYPDTHGAIEDRRELVAALHAVGALAIACTDLLALTVLTPPGEWGADIAVGSTQRFGVPIGFGGPHAAFMAVSESLTRLIPGRMVGVSHDSRGRPALRLALQTREQHIRRDRATSNICTAQVLPAILASLYAVYHGPEGLARIAARIRTLTLALRTELANAGFTLLGPGTSGPVFDTLVVEFATSSDRDHRYHAALEAGITLDRAGTRHLGISLDERSDRGELDTLLRVFGIERRRTELDALLSAVDLRLPIDIERRTPYLTKRVFHEHHSETKLLRYVSALERRDLSLADAMIPLGSCTMKLNPAAALEPISYAGFAEVHPFAPRDQVGGYLTLAAELETWLSAVTGFPGVSLQPNSGAQGEYTGLLAIRGYHLARGDRRRNVCLVPVSAHGTNPASAVMAGMRVVVVRSGENGAIDLDDLRRVIAAHEGRVAALMLTYPSTHGVFEREIRTVIDLVHTAGGQVYMDGANMNAQLGLTSPATIGADVCHLNLHKTFAIPHGGGGPGVGPVLCAEHLREFLPGSPEAPGPVGIVAGSTFGSAGVLPISYAFIAMLGAEGLAAAAGHAILAANYIAHRLRRYIPIAYADEHGLVAHECILDFRDLEKNSGVTVEDVAKRLMDFGFHAPTMSWPVAGSLMVEPTESEDRAQLDRFCDAMIAIIGEIDDVAAGRVALEESPLHHAPHTLADIAEPWRRPYDIATGCFPAPWVAANKFWPAVNRVDNVHGDRNLQCSCDPLESYRIEALQS